MPTYGYVIVGALALALVLGGVWTSRLLWLRQVRRFVVRLSGRQEAVLAGERALRDTIEQLAAAGDARLHAFAADPGSEDRTVLAEVAQRMEIERHELEEMALPRRLWPVADLLAGAAEAVSVAAREAGGEGDDALEALGRVDLGAVRAACGAADEEMRRLCDAYGCAEASIYGGGLYV